MDCSPSGSTAHGIFQARILEWVAILPFLSLQDLPNPGMEPASPESLALASNSFPLFPLGSPKQFILSIYKTAAPTALTQGIQDNIIKNILFGH